MSDALTLTGGARIDRWWIDDGFLDQRSLSTGEQLADSAVFANRSGWEPTGRAGLAWRPNNAVTVRGVLRRLVDWR